MDFTSDKFKLNCKFFFLNLKLSLYSLSSSSNLQDINLNFVFDNAEIDNYNKILIIYG
jgi:hypothetical protein